MTTSGPHRTHGRKFLEALAEAGIIDPKDCIRRVIIDAAVDSAVTIYVERFGDERMLSLALEPLLKDGGYVIPHEPVGSREPAEQGA